MAVRVMRILFLLPLIFHGTLKSDACRFGSRCAFPCNCNGGTCDPDTGSCPSGCKSGQPPSLGYDWTGPGCQIGNVAYNKDTNQTGAYSGLVSRNAVDGNVGSRPTGDDYCAHPSNPDRSQPAEWTVDLGDTYTVYNVTFHNAHGAGGSQRLANFDLWVEETSVNREHCEYYNGPAPAESASLTIQCGGVSGYVGRYVHLRRREGAIQANLITLCEVVVWGHRYIDCSDCPSGVSCSNIIGCDQCPAGKQLPDCKQVCQASYYGVNCAESCGLCKDGADCQATDGYCQNGCQLWWAGDTCKVEIVLPGCCQGDEGSDPIEDSDITSSSVTLSWTQETSVPQGYDSYYGYIVKYRIDSQAYQTFPAISHDSTQTKLTTTVPGLEENSLYFFRIIPYRKSGEHEELGWAYDEARATTKCSVPVKPDITEITKQDQGNPSFTVHYQLPEYKDNGCFDGVMLQYKLFTASLWENKTISRTPATDSITANNLREDGYYVRIHVYNKDAEIYSDQHNVVFKGTAPPPPLTSSSPIPSRSASTSSTAITSEVIGEFNQHKSGLSNTELIIIAVIVVVVVIGVVVIIVVRHVYRYRREFANPGGPAVSYVNQAVPVAVVQPEDMQSESQYEDVGVTSTDVHIKETAYQHLDGQGHKDYENSFTTGPYAELR